MTLICKLQRAVGRIEQCPEGGCAFWEPGGAVLEGRCAFDRIDLDATPELAGELLRLRRALESLEPEDEEVRRRFYRLLNDAD